jgi:hypothetical protein
MFYTKHFMQDFDDKSRKPGLLEKVGKPDNAIESTFRLEMIEKMFGVKHFVPDFGTKVKAGM